jgi:hypothetical protein
VEQGHPEQIEGTTWRTGFDGQAGMGSDISFSVAFRWLGGASSTSSSGIISTILSHQPTCRSCNSSSHFP